MEQHQAAATLVLPEWPVAFVGTSLDPRGAAAVEFVRARATQTFRLGFDPDRQSLLLDDAPLSLEQLDALVADAHIAVEATTLGFVEVFLLLRACQRGPRGSADLLYLEPLEYNSEPAPAPARQAELGKRDFILTERTRVYSAVPTAGLLLSEREPVHAAFLMGFEGSRLARLFDEVEVRPDHCALIFGVPAFEPGWEMNSFANNIDVTFDFRVPRIEYAGAQNPLAAYQALERIHAGSTGGRLLIAPIGTKPHGIAAALYACEHEEVGLIYDHPVRRKDRSGSLSRWHLFQVQFAPSPLGAVRSGPDDRAQPRHPPGDRPRPDTMGAAADQDAA
jgi:hypothetical protein